MHIIAVDDEQLSLAALTDAILEAAPDCSLISFSNPLEAVAHAKAEKVDAAFLDIQMAVMDGMVLARKLQKIHPRINIVFVTGHLEYTLDAFGIRASGYVFKPVSAGAVKKELEDLRYTPDPIRKKMVRIQTFGNFDIFVDNNPVIFHRRKAKELLAYLVDRRGGTVTKKELATVLWEETEYNRSTQTHLQILISEMLRALKEAGAGSIIRRSHNSLSVIPEKIDCDYYRFMRGDWNAIEEYQEEYMANYSWAEMTAGTLSAQKKRYRR
ncbi:response regulator [Breznakiella homolactica]|uniref:Response regulator n=1 Tax=Breznakiella homolactica TaxID=2798577 RepID=A0A7T8B9K9_9SPIR|nr:response regulator [Breznakiella homolactica]QQO09724.1 response regulator [Breznakiella homolactica]